MDNKNKKINADPNKNYELFSKNYEASFKLFLNRDLDLTAKKTGGAVCDENKLVLDFFEKKVILDSNRQKIFILQTNFFKFTGNEEPLDQFTSSIILHYVLTADNSAVLDEWILYRDLPNGMFYANTIPGVLAPVIRKYETDGLLFLERMEKIGGKKQKGFKFASIVLPFKKFPILFILDEKDDEFEAGLRVLFDRSAHHFLKTDIIKTLLVYIAKNLTE